MTDTYFKQALAAFDAIESAASSAEAITASREAATTVLLSAYQKAETDGINAHDFKVRVCDAKGWSYKVFDVQADKQVTVDGSEAPAKVKVYFSQAKSAFAAKGSLAGFKSWKELRDSYKEVDTTEAANIAWQKLRKAMKKRNNTDWNTYVVGLLEKVEVQIATKGSELGKLDKAA
jgi:hypothetical protein